MAAVAVITLRERDPHASRDDAVALRILLTHVQAVGSLCAFKISGTAEYKLLISCS